ncbi:hypothetical protein [Vibrio genomosp. F10]|nr:hypothetical protein [Vibrio genomosp. F10]
MKKQGGFGYILPLVVMAILASSALLDTLMFTKEVKRYDHFVKNTTDKVVEIVKSAWTFHLDDLNNEPDPTSINRWPENTDSLYAVNYLEQCDPLASCIEINRTLWDSPIEFERFVPQDVTDPLNPIDLPAKIRFTIDTSGATDNGAGDIGLAMELASHFPAGSVIGTEISFSVSRPAVDIAHNALTRTDGTNLPTAHWDFDGFNITEMGDMNFKDYIGGDGTPVSLRDSVFDTISLYSHGSYINKPSCPAGSISKIYLGMSQLVGRNSKAVKMGSFQTYATDSGSRWMVNIRYYTQNTSGVGYWEYPDGNNGKALAFTRCETI